MKVHGKAVMATLEGHSRRNWNTEYLQDMPGKSLNEWNCTLEGDFSFVDELTGKQRLDALQNKFRERKPEGMVGRHDLSPF